MTVPRRVLVVSDRYPPEVAGGAELSLHDTLKALDPAAWECRVIALSDRTGVRRTTVDGIAVAFVGAEAGWPVRLGQIKARLSTMGRWQKRLVGPFVALGLLVAYLAQSFAGFGRRFGRVLLLARLAAFDRDHFGRLEEAYDRRSPPSRLIQAAIDDWHPDIVHFDNKDSIMLSATIDAGPAGTVAMVRDHRFFCGHPRQRMMVGERACATCAFGCVDDLGQPQRGMIEREMAQAIALRHAALAGIDTVLTTSGYLVDQLARAGVRQPAQALGNPHPPIADYERAAGGIERADPPEILFVGHLRDAKGPMVLVDCLPQLAQALGDFKLVFAGRGPLHDAIVARAGAMGLGRHVKMLGFAPRDDIYRRLARASVVVTPTLWPEPFGRVPLESAVARRPIVASTLGGHIETVIDGETGLLVLPDDADALAAAMIGLIADPARAKAMGDAAYDHVTRIFAPQTVAGRIAAAWSGILKISKPPESKVP